MLPAAFRAPPLELRDRAPALGPEQQHGPPVGRRHLPQLSPQTLVIRVPLTPPLPRQLVDLPHRPRPPSRRSQTLLRLQLQVKLHRLFKPFAPGVLALSGSKPAADLEGEDGGEEEEGEAEEVEGGGGGEREREGGEWGEEREGVEDVGEVGGEEEGAGEEDEDEDEEV